MTRAPICTLAELDTLDTDEVLAGYRSGRAGDDEPGGNHSISYWHGWRNGAADAGHRTTDQAQMTLARAYLADQRARRNTALHQER